MSGAQRERDGYDDAVEYLTAHPEEIEGAWYHDGRNHAECLFSFVTKSGNNDRPACGCLLMIRSDVRFRAPTGRLTSAIRFDARIPENVEDITPDSLPVFAEWQRRIDKELGRTPPPRMKATVTPC